MIARDILKDAYENGYAYKVIITLGNGARKEALYPETTPMRTGTANLFNQFEDGDRLEGATVSFHKNPKTPNYVPLKKVSMVHIYKDGHEIAVMTRSQFLRSDYRGKSEYTHKGRRETVRM